MKLLLFVYLLICAFGLKVHAKDIYIGGGSGGYYWREYTGTLPSDALSGGSSSAYIGQMLHSGSATLIPGHINPSSEGISYIRNTERFTTTKEIMILCTKHPEDFEWIKAESQKTVSSVLNHDMRLVIVHRGSDSSLGVARIHDGGKIKIGHVKVVDNVFQDMYAVNKRKETSFEVLVYKPSGTNSTKQTININVL